MHDRALAADLVREAAWVARREGTGRVAGLRVRIGALSHVVPGHLREAIEVAALGSPVEGAAVEIRVSGEPDLDVWLEDVTVEVG